jgi:putative (di)nucleoside polyphosphate hydrolase
MTQPRYRPCVGIALFNQDGLVFTGERIDNPGEWQMPQGGMDEGESPIEAALRELKEETGTDKADIIRVHEQKIRYDFPDDLAITLSKRWGDYYTGQEQTWFAMRFTGHDSDIDLDADEQKEFLSWRWAPLATLPALIVPFKREVYKQVAQAFSDIR